MIYLYAGKIYFGLRLLPQEAGQQPDGVQKLSVIAPPHDPDWEYLTAEGGQLDVEKLTYTLAVRQVRQYAVCNPAWVVQRLVTEPERAELVPVPYALNRHIRPGWRYDPDAETFLPPALEMLRADLRAGAGQMVEDARNAIAQPVGPSEIGLWLMNYVGVALHLAGQPTPLWDRALAVEAGLTGEAVEVLRQTHIERARDYHDLAGLTQGLARQAKSAFAALDDVGQLLGKADHLRETVAAAQADPDNAIAKFVGESGHGL